MVKDKTKTIMRDNTTTVILLSDITILIKIRFTGYNRLIDKIINR